jgi:hypothetical protein
MDRTALKERLARYKALLEENYDLEEKLLGSAKQSASMDTGDGRVSFTNRGLEDVRKNINSLEATIKNIEQRLAGKGVINVRLRRHC